MIHEIIANFSYTLSDKAESCGTNWAEARNYVTFNGQKIKHNRIALTPKYRGKVFVVGHKFTAKDGKEYPIVIFYTNKHGGVTEVFNGFREHMASRGYSDAWIKKEMPPKAIEFEKTPIVEIEQWQIDRLEKYGHAAWSAATTKNIKDFDYKKGLINFEGVEVRRGIGRFGECLMVQIFNLLGKVIGYQHIYKDGQNIRKAGEKPSNKDIIGQYGGGFIVIGDRNKIKHGAWICEGLATGLGIYHANGNGKDTLSNKKKLPVIVALSAGNMTKVTRAFTELGNADLRTCADNDESKTGQYIGIQCASISGTRKYYLPEKGDFADTLKFTLYSCGRNPVEHLQQLIKFSPTEHLKKLGIRLAFAVARLVPYQYDEQAAIEIVEHTLKSRNFDGKCNADQIIKHSVQERREIVERRNKITNFEGINRIKFDSVPDNKAVLKSLTLALEVNSIIFDSRGLGAGKTELLEGLRKLLAIGNKIAVITHRESLTYDLATRLNTDHYKEDAPETCSQFLTICVNSLPKFSIASRGFNILFIDEARQVIEHLTHGTVTNRQAAFNEFVAAIEAAEYVFCADADMNDATVEFFRKHAKGKLLHAIDAPSAENNKTIHMMGSHASNMLAIGAAISKGENIFVGCTSKNKAIEAYEFVKKDAKGELLLIHSENKDDPKQAAFLKNPNVEAIKYQGVFHSPTIGSGVSIVVDHFTENYLLNSGNLPENEVLQMTARNRRAPDIFISCSDQASTKLIEDIDLMREGKGKQAQSYLENFDGVGFNPNELGLLRIEHNAVKNHALNDFANNFYLLAEINGYAIDRSTMAHENIIKEDKESLKGFAADVKDETCDRIFNAPDVDAIAADKLSKHKQAERDQLDKLATKQMKGDDNIDHVDIHRFKFDGVMKPLINHETLHSSKRDCMTWDEVNHQTQDRSQYKTSVRKLSRAVIVEKIAAQTIKNKSRRKLWLKLIEKATPTRSMQALEKRLSKARITSRESAKICKYLKENAAEVFANGLGNYDREIKKYTQALDGFIKQFGYEIEEIYRNESVHYFLIKPIDYISLYAMNRAALRH